MGSSDNGGNRRAILIIAVVIIVAVLAVTGVVMSGALDKKVADASVPGAPTLASATPAGDKIELVWAAPATDGGSQITGYQVYCGNASPLLYSNFGASARSCNVTGITAGIAFNFTVVAVNAKGSSVHSNTLSAYLLPDHPVLASVVAGSSNVTLTWAAPSGNVNLTGYNVFYGREAPDTLFSVQGPSVLNLTIPGLTPGVRYLFAVSAVTPAGASTISNVADATPFTTPGAIPQGVEVWLFPGNVTLSWSAPLSDGGSPLLGYRICLNPESEPVSWGPLLGPDTANATIHYDHQSGGSYRLMLVAVNAAGNGVICDLGVFSSSATIDAPQIIGLHADPTEVSVDWTIAFPAEGPVATGYALYYGPSPALMNLYAIYSADTRYTVVENLDPGAYYFGVRAIYGAVYSNMSNIEMTEVPALPGPPTSAAAEAGIRMVTLSWSAPARTGGTPITGYRVSWGSEEWLVSNSFDLGDDQLAVEIADLVAGHTYYFSIGALNANGAGPTTGILSAEPYDLPDPPFLYSAVPGMGAVSLGWGASQYDGGKQLLGYRVYYGTTEGSYTQFGSLLSPSTFNADVTGLTPHETYYFAVTSVTSAGESAPSSPLIAVPKAAPQAPVLTGAVIGPTGVTLTWNAPSDAAVNPVIRYTIYYGTASPPSQVYGNTDYYTSVEVTGLVVGSTYYFAVTATTFDGQYHESPQSNIRSVTMAAVPEPPVLISATAGDGKVSLSWTTPSPGSSPIIGYTVYCTVAAPGMQPLTMQTAGTSIDFTGLTAGLGYHFWVKAYSAVGESAMSNHLISSPVGVPTLEEISLSQADLQAGWEAYSPFSYGLQESITGIADCGGLSLVRNGTTQEIAIFNYVRFSNQSSAAAFYADLVTMLAARGYVLTELAVGDRAVMMDRAIGSDGRQIFMLVGNDIAILMYGVTSGTADPDQAILLAEQQAAKMASLQTPVAAGSIVALAVSCPDRLCSRVQDSYPRTSSSSCIR